MDYPHPPRSIRSSSASSCSLAVPDGHGATRAVLIRTVREFIKIQWSRCSSGIVMRYSREEDIAYCLFGIFDVELPITYGKDTRAVGRLLEHILARSDNVTILACSGISGSIHSYLPSDLTVYGLCHSNPIIGWQSKTTRWQWLPPSELHGSAEARARA
jgi:hypothetical protein